MNRGVNTLAIGSERGFSVFEMLVVLSLTAMVTAIAVPGLLGLQGSFERDGALKQVEYAVRRSKAEALSRGSRTILNISEAGTALSLGIDTQPYSATFVPDLEIASFELPRGMEAIFSRILSFDSRGLLVNEAGVPTTGAITLQRDGQTFCSATVSAVGVLQFGC